MRASFIVGLMNWWWGQVLKLLQLRWLFPKEVVNTKTNGNSHLSRWHFIPMFGAVWAAMDAHRNSYSVRWFHMCYICLPARVNPHCRRPEKSPSLLQYIDSGRTLNKWCPLSAWVKYNLYLVPEDKQLTNLSATVKLQWQHALFPYLVHLSNSRIGVAVSF